MLGLWVHTDTSRFGVFLFNFFLKTSFMCMHVCLCIDATCVQVSTGARKGCWIPSSCKSPVWALGTKLSSLEEQRAFSTTAPSLQAHTSSFFMRVLGSNSSHEAGMAEAFTHRATLLPRRPSFSSLFGFPAFNPAHRGFGLCSAIFLLCWSF